MNGIYAGLIPLKLKLLN